MCTGYTGVEGTFATWENVTVGAGDGVVSNEVAPGSGNPQLTEFPLDNIDDMRMDILEAVRDVTAFAID